MADKPPGAGRSSFDLIDHQKLFRHLDLKEGATFLDVASGRGSYSLAAAKMVGPTGRVLAVDLWAKGIEGLNRMAREQGLTNIETAVSDLRREIPFPGHCADVALMATTLHDFTADGSQNNVLREVARILKPRGRLAVVEFKDLDGPPGPPRHIRISPQQVEDALTPHGFLRRHIEDIGPYNYMALFQAADVL